ncbi:hypothetical protein AbraCBS73388_003244 [Aspergillus brasiliensis]|uniref:Uncharacterized protein n=1 Tax=Aspergillus brasiliensis TaxID=319629 RepID=A0A9W6DT67_9EURO|nr:hypothetical protein AbraCBS73388_003244 [Aspergillus brasiliensis]
MIQDDDVDTDLPIDTDLDDATATDIPLPLPGETTSMATFILYVRLLRIFSNCLKSLYTTTKRRSGVAKITALDHELSVWRHSLLDMHKAELVAPDTGPNTSIDIQTISAAEDLVRLFSSRMNQSRHASTPFGAVSVAQGFPSSSVPIPPDDQGSHEPANLERESPMATIPLDFGILDDGILDFDWP